MTTEPSLVERITEAIRTGEAPEAARLAAARGALPLEASELAAIQVLLLDDENPEVADEARAALASLPADVASDLAARAATPDALLRFLAGAGDPAVLAALAENQVAIRRDPDIGSFLSRNPALPDTQRARLLDFLSETDKEARQAAAAAAEASARTTGHDDASAFVPGLDDAVAPASDPFLASLGIDAEVEALLPELELDMGRLAERSELLGDPDDPEELSNLVSALSKMNVGQKLRRALFGTREERSVLVRDTNRIVAAAVVKNPKFTEREAEMVSNSRNVSDDVLRLIGRHRDFAKSYSIQHNLVRNPRTPTDLTMHFIPRLNDRDLKMLVKNRNVSDGVRRQAKKIIEMRESRRRVRVTKR